jgi:hypothetical protein
MDLTKATKEMRSACQQLLKFLERGSKKSVKCMVYFDEAHKLAEPPSEPTRPGRLRSVYHNLGKVLADLISEPVFFVFLSTNSHLQRFAPSAANHPSNRTVTGSSLLPPFTELPFDVFSGEVFDQMNEEDMPISLANVCMVDRMVAFGRTLHVIYFFWFSDTNGVSLQVVLVS